MEVVKIIDFYMFISGLCLLILGFVSFDDKIILLDMMCEIVDFISGLKIEIICKFGYFLFVD